MKAKEDLMRVKRLFAGIVLLPMVISLSYGQGYTRFHQGNSLTAEMRELFSQVAKDGGFPDDEFVAYGLAGTPIDFAWESSGSNSTYRELLQSGAPYDMIELQPFKSRRRPEDEADAAVQFYEVALNHSPACTLLMYYTWVNTPRTYDTFAEWREAQTRYIDSTLVPMTDLLEGYFPDNPVYVVPTGVAILALQDSIEAGKLPRFSSIDDIFHDGIHCNSNGNYFNACVHYAAIYQRSPVGLPHYYIQDIAIFTDTVDLTDEEAAIFQRTAWDVVRNYPRTLVSRAARPKADTQAPSAPTGLSLSSRTKLDFTVSWNASTDNVGVAEYYVHAFPTSTTIAQYETYRCVGVSQVAPTVVDGGFTSPSIQAGVTYDVYVRARDAEYNLSPPSDTITVEIPPAVQGDRYKYDFTTGASPVKAGFTEVLTSQDYTAARGYGYTMIVSNARVYEDATASDTLCGDGHWHFNKFNFDVDVENGVHDVTMYFGAVNLVDVEAEDSLVLEDVTIADGQTGARTFTIEVTDGRLSLAVTAAGGWNLRIAGLEIVPQSVRSAKKVRLDVARGTAIRFNARTGTITATSASDDQVHCALLDSRGRLLGSRAGRNGVVALPTGTLPAGLYIVRMYDNTSVLTKAIVKQ